MNRFPSYKTADEVTCFHCGIAARDARPMGAGADASHRDSGYPPRYGQFQFTCQCGRRTYYDLPTITKQATR